ncbi:hypothetical protein NQ318_021467, partial [Aromia moschata]
GDSCDLKNGGKGTCVNLRQCSTAITLLQEQKTVPQICGFIGFDALVCCNDEKQKAPQNIKEPGAVKCKEYYPYAIYGILIPGGEQSLAREFPHMAAIGFGKTDDIQWLCGGSLISPNYVLTAAHCLNSSQLDRIEILMMIGVGDKMRTQQEVCRLFHEMHPDREPVSQSTVSRIERKYRELGHVRDAPRQAHPISLGMYFRGPPRYVRLGELDFATEQDDAQPQDFTVKRVIPHPDFRPVSGRYHDIGLIELDRNVIPTHHVSFACLDTVRAHKEPQMISTGWGRTEFSGRTSTHLLKINLDTVSIDECQRFYQGARREVPRGVVDDLQLCAGGKPDQDTCQGDSGGPLQLRYEDVGSAIYAYTIVGITSFGKACGLSRTPGIYTRVYGYLSWIEGIVWP